MSITIHAGHNRIVPGASAVLDEVTENRKVLAACQRLSGGAFTDCTDDEGRTQSQNLATLCDNMNRSGADYNLSIHLNSGGGTGCECLIYPGSKSRALAEKISAGISATLGIRNRGVKERSNLYVLRHTTAPTIIVECAFVDSQNDADKWDVDAVAQSIVSACGLAVVSTPAPSEGYLVRITASSLNVRSGPGTQYGVATAVKRGEAFTIVEESMNGSTRWGKLKSGAGWISLAYTEQV